MANYNPPRCKICNIVLARQGQYCKAHRNLPKTYSFWDNRIKNRIPASLHGKAFQDAFDKAFGLGAL